MDLIGKWKVKKAACVTPGGMKLCTAAEVPADKAYDHSRLVCQSVFEFCADGTAYQLLSPESLAQIDAYGEVDMLDGMAIVDRRAWKAEDGHYFCDTEANCSVGDELIDLFEKLETDENGYLPVSGGLLLLERIGV